jgi:2-iminobutanoate/2-iminopropanoate deaminase
MERAMSKAATISSELPPPGGPYSHVVEARGFAYTAGLGPDDPATGAVPDGIRAQTGQVLRNLETALAAVGLTMADVVKTTVHLADLQGDFAAFNEVYRTRFPEPFPVRTTVGSQLAGILVEIDAVAVRPS